MMLPTSPPAASPLAASPASPPLPALPPSPSPPSTSPLPASPLPIFPPPASPPAASPSMTPALDGGRDPADAPMSPTPTPTSPVDGGLDPDVDDNELDVVTAGSPTPPTTPTSLSSTHPWSEDDILVALSPLQHAGSPPKAPSTPPPGAVVYGGSPPKVLATPPSTSSPPRTPAYNPMYLPKSPFGDGDEPDDDEDDADPSSSHPAALPPPQLSSPLLPCVSPTPGIPTPPHVVGLADLLGLSAAPPTRSSDETPAPAQQGQQHSLPTEGGAQQQEIPLDLSPPESPTAAASAAPRHLPLSPSLPAGGDDATITEVPSITGVPSTPPVIHTLPAFTRTAIGSPPPPGSPRSPRSPVPPLLALSHFQRDGDPTGGISTPVVSSSPSTPVTSTPTPAALTGVISTAYLTPGHIRSPKPPLPPRRTHTTTSPVAAVQTRILDPGEPWASRFALAIPPSPPPLPPPPRPTRQQPDEEQERGPWVIGTGRGVQSDDDEERQQPEPDVDAVEAGRGDAGDALGEEEPDDDGGERGGDVTPGTGAAAGGEEDTGTRMTDEEWLVQRQLLETERRLGLHRRFASAMAASPDRPDEASAADALRSVFLSLELHFFELRNSRLPLPLDCGALLGVTLGFLLLFFFSPAAFFKNRENIAGVGESKPSYPPGLEKENP
ncbi:hypothetical protein PAPYR_4235 [Paratrimastix pyriformis]|uniref:Uncharacterized protein n=1 Tax=Paratrimastix pyriformis TaxID=342808 RepID=A0ABQ8UQL3_9EUKA|nr:hypothetical protein PAPYR_4235 [Paratrimastix pyriformis]